ncbi:leucine-rich repeats and immunoglobulin-like domains protein sma-10 [Culex pipiens pallens]|uniref:leucine-rich repeats and immunoglobulin-like domains protein sma-10 n=1 Tax=Culex pipiens pallens TaxID=42434 RepID=UPI0022AA3EA6|nr:leucine-rich repeats and immunoglobulin-like domains protein sma-10 [Culex pipiens pallens]
MGTKPWLSLVALLFVANQVNGWYIFTFKNGSYNGVTSVSNDVDLGSLSLNVTGIDEVQFGAPNFSTLTLEMQSWIINVGKFSLQSENVSTVYVGAHFVSFSIERGPTSTVVIDPSSIYETEQFRLSNGQLNELPKNLLAMKKLKMVDFKNNQIEIVNMEDFSGLKFLEQICLSKNKIKKMSVFPAVLPRLERFDISYNKLEIVNMSHFNSFPNLETINLARNRIIEISSDPVELPNLTEFDVSFNRLNEISFEHWNTSSVKQIHIAVNRLTMAHGFPKVFPALQQVSLVSNPFNCDWLDTTQDELKSRNVEIEESSMVTCDKSVTLLEDFKKIIKQLQSQVELLKPSSNQNGPTPSGAGNQKQFERQIWRMEQKLESFDKMSSSMEHPTGVFLQIAARFAFVVLYIPLLVHLMN